MDASYRRISKAFFIGLIVLISCNPGSKAPGGIAPESTPTPTISISLPYWDLLPLEFEPIGGWTSHRMEEAKIAFQYPSIYETGNCGTIFTEYKDVQNYKALLIGFEGSSIRIHIYDEMEESGLEDFARTGKVPSAAKLVTPVERFWLGGRKAFRYVGLLLLQETTTLDYHKTAAVYHNDKVYKFSYANLSYFSSCEAPPLTEEQVYEYLISTFEFLD